MKRVMPLPLAAKILRDDLSDYPRESAIKLAHSLAHKKVRNEQLKQ
jgi:hypothetical protein